MVESPIDDKRFTVSINENELSFNYWSDFGGTWYFIHLVTEPVSGFYVDHRKFPVSFLDGCSPDIAFDESRIVASNARDTEITRENFATPEFNVMSTFELYYADDEYFDTSINILGLDPSESPCG